MRIAVIIAIVLLGLRILADLMGKANEESESIRAYFSLTRNGFKKVYAIDFVRVFCFVLFIKVLPFIH